jgi:hypothetical protein
METAEQGRPTLKKKSYRERFLTVVVMGGLGRIRSFRVSRRILLGSSLFFGAFILFSIVVINRYLDLREEHNALLNRMSVLEENLSTNKKALQRSMQLSTFLEEYIFQAEGRPEMPSQAGKEAASQGKRAETLKTASSKEAAEGAKTKSPADLLQIKDLLIEQEGAKLSVNFKLEVSQPGPNPVGGYIHIIAEDSTSDARQWWAYPEQKLINGLPENFRNGYRFSVYQHRLIHGRVYLGSRPTSPPTIRILIYDQSGTLMKEKRLEVSYES